MSKWVSTIAFAPKYNSEGKHDATGAFHPEAKKFLEASGGDGETKLYLFDNRKPMASRAEEIFDELLSHKTQRRSIRCVAFFCHGYKRGIQAGFRSSGKRANVEDLAIAIADTSGIGVIVPLYCCSTAGSPKKGAPGGDGGFADELRDALCRQGAVNCRVDAHTTVAHTTKNPHVRRFEGRGSKVGGIGGMYLVTPGSKNWSKWRRMLRGETRFLFSWWETGHVAENVEEHATSR